MNTWAWIGLLVVFLHCAAATAVWLGVTNLKGWHQRFHRRTSRPYSCDHCAAQRWDYTRDST